MWVTWREAMREALYSPAGFYARGERPAWHFRTSVHASPRYAAAMLTMLSAVDAALGRPARLDLVDVGAGGGELLGQMLARAAEDPGLAGRIRPRAVEVTPRPAGLDERIGWADALPADVCGLVIASEWLDNIPLDVAELTPGGPRLILVEKASGAERAGPPASTEDRAWLDRWWPLRCPGERAELGMSRSQAWASVISRLGRGVAVAVDYGHLRADRPVTGTLAGYAEGRVVRAIPDGSRDVTAHVAMDACAEAGMMAGATATLLTRQREALRALGLGCKRPAAALAGADPAGYAAALRQASEDGELTDPAGLGGFWWLVQAAGVPLPPALATLGAGRESPPG